jgi:hypothetical protein
MRSNHKRLISIFAGAMLSLTGPALATDDSANVAPLAPTTCTINWQPSAFKLHFDSATRQATVTGPFYLPNPGYKFDLLPVPSLDQSQNFVLERTPPPPGMLYPQVIAEIDSIGPFSVDSGKKDVTIRMDEFRTTKVINCPLP